MFHKNKQNHGMFNLEEIFELSVTQNIIRHLGKILKVGKKSGKDGDPWKDWVNLDYCTAEIS